MVIPKSRAMSFEEMMTMDDEDLGKEYRKSGDWKHSETYQKTGATLLGISVSMLFIEAIVLSIMLVLTFKSPSIFLPRFNSVSPSMLIVCAVGIFLCVYSLSDLTLFKKMFHYERFNNLMDGGYFDNFKSNMSYDEDAGTGLSRYMNCFQKIVPNIQSCSDAEVGRLLKLMIPIVFMKSNGVHIDERNYSSINEQYHLTDRIITLVNDIEARMERERVQSGKDKEEENRLKAEERKTSEVINKFKELDDRVKTRKEALDGSSDYHRLMNATNQLKHKASTIRETSSGLTEEKA